jgi:putative hydroxymethylpyrimidine transport system substrate-binding protein
MNPLRPSLLLPTLLAVLALAGLGGCAQKQDDLTAPAARTISVALDGPVSANHVGLLLARDRGFFREAGLEVGLRSAAGPDEALADLLEGRASLALTSQPVILQARNEALPAISVAAIVQEPLAALMTVDGDPVAPKALRGRTVGTAGTDYANAVLTTLMNEALVDPDAVQRRDLGDDLVRPLVRGRVDASLGPFWNTDGVALAVRGQKPEILRVEQGGLPPYDEVVLAARGVTVQRDGALVRRFLQALQRGTQLARAEPAAAVAALRTADPELSAPVARRSVARTLGVLAPPEAGRPIGWQDYREWQAFAAWMTDAGLLTRPIDAGEALTNEFLPGEGVGSSGSGPTAG